jgi:hypothetical protein
LVGVPLRFDSVNRPGREQHGRLGSQPTDVGRRLRGLVIGLSVLSGEMTFRVGEDTIIGRAGDFAWAALIGMAIQLAVIGIRQRSQDQQSPPLLSAGARRCGA